MKEKLAICAALIFVAASALLLVFSSVAAASDAQGALVFVVTFPASFAILSLGAALTRKVRSGGGRITHFLSLGFLGFNIAFLVFAFIPGLNLFTQTVMDGIVAGYKSYYGASPYEAHHPKVDLPGLIAKALEASGGESLDLRGLNLPYPWQRLCLFRPHTSNEEAMKAARLPNEWKLSLYSKIAMRKDITALVLLREDYPAYFADLPRSLVEFPDSLGGHCVEKSQAFFRRQKPAENGLGPTLTL